MAVTTTFDDEFNTLSLWNGTSGTWDTDAAYDTPTDNGYTLASNGEQEWYINSNYAPTASVKPWTVNNGLLTLTAAPASSAISSLINGYQYTSGQLNTYHSFSQTYGYFEERAQLPAGQGLWPAFWLMPENGSWPPELDIMEMLGQNPSTYYTTVHDNALPNTFVGQADNVVNTSTGYHTYAVDWEPDFITFYFDGQQVDKIATPADFNSPMYMITNLAVGGSWPGHVNSSTPMPAQMNIDFIRAYSSMPSWIANGTDPADIGSGGGGTGSGGGSGSGGGGSGGSSGGSTGGTVPTGTSVADYTVPNGVTSVVMTSTNAQTIHANNLGDTITANDAVSTIIGGTGNDTEIAGHNADTLTGGGGSDTFEFNFVPWSAGHITDFAPAMDKIDLSAVLASYGYTGTTPIADGWVSLQSDGAGDTQVYVNAHSASFPYPLLITTLDHVAPTSVSDADFGHGSSSPPAGTPGMPQGTVLGPIETMSPSDATTAGGAGGTTTSLPVSPVYGNGSGLVINVTYDQSVSSLPAGFVAAVNYVVSYLESTFTTPTTVNIDVGYGEIGGQAMASNALGESETYLGAYNYATVKSALAAADPSAAAGLPANTPAGAMWVPTAEVKALGLSLQQAATNVDGYVGFSSGLPFTYDPNNQSVAGTYDFIGVVEHEITEVMGRMDLLGESIANTIGYTPLDMFHFTAPGVHTYTGTTPNYFSANGGVTNLDNFNSNPSGDLGDWASSAGADAFVAFSPSGQATNISQADIAEMNALGYAGAAPSVTIESAGSTALVETGGFYYMDPVSGGTGVELKSQGAPVVANAMGGWMAIGAEAISGGYEVAWKLAGANLYSVWDTDTSGNFTSVPIGAVPGSSGALEAVETSFNQDLNGDGTIGPIVTTIEAAGATKLLEIGDNYFMEPVAGGTEVSLKAGGPVIADGMGGWMAIGAEAISGGYEVAWKLAGANLYSVWDTDTSGNLTTVPIGAVSASNGALEAIETSFGQDLNGDGTIGPIVTTIEAAGATKLLESGDNYFMEPVAGGTEVSLKAGGPVIADGMGGWMAIGAEAISGGYEVAWKLAGANLYSVWDTDTSGNLTTVPIGAVSASNGALEAIETSFGQDLNGDGTIGPIVTTIEAAGATKLLESGDNYFMEPVAGGTEVSVKAGGNPVMADGMGGWIAIGAEAISGGYEVAWEVPGANLYSVWDTDTNGNLTSVPIGAVSASNGALEAIETSFDQDLNGDGTIGPIVTTIEAAGATKLLESGDNYFMEPVAGGTEVSVKAGGNPVMADGMGGWIAIGAEAISGGYEVAWEVPGANLYSVWDTDTNGNLTSVPIGAVPGSSGALEAIETSFHQDLNSDGVIGPIVTTIAAAGSTMLLESGDNYLIEPVGGGTEVSLKSGGAPVMADGMGGWMAIGAQAISGGYEVAWKFAGANLYSVWDTDTTGNLTSVPIGGVPGSSAALEAIETSFHQDLNGDGVIGVPPPNHDLV